jgi:hypothetical protein
MLGLKTTLSLIRMLMFFLYLCANIAIFYGFSNLHGLQYVIALSIILSYVYLCTLDTLTKVNIVLEDLDKELWLDYRCNQNIYLKGTTDVVFTEDDIYYPVDDYDNGLVLINNHDNEHYIPYSFLNKHFERIGDIDYDC